MSMSLNRNRTNVPRTMRLSHAAALVAAMSVAACAVGTQTAARANVRDPLGAFLTPGATTGAPVPLRFDPNAKVIISTAKDLPPASYAPSQAQRGEQIYQRTCGMCHAAGALVGQAFVDNWNNRRVYDLYALVHSTMPLDNPGGLKDGEYLDVVAYLLQANKHVSAGMDSLRADTVSLRKTRIAFGNR
jgi:mono/diheme cytochrome c family protein